MALLKGTSRYVNEYEKAHNYYSTNNPLFNEVDWRNIVYGKDSSDLDMYIYAMEKTEGIDSSEFFKNYTYDYADSETRMAAIYNEVFADRSDKKDYVIERPYTNSVGYTGTTKEYVNEYEYNKYLINEKNNYNFQVHQQKLEAERIRLEKENMAWYEHVGSFLASVGGNILKELDHLGTTIAALFTTAILEMPSWITGDENIVDIFIRQYGNGQTFYNAPTNLVDMMVGAAQGEDVEADESLGEALVDFERRYTYLRDEQGNLTTFGEIVIGATQTATDMVVLGGLGGHLGAAAARITGATGKLASVIGQTVSTATYYVPLTARSVAETAEYFNSEGISYNSNELLANQMVKTGVEIGIELGLGKIFGSTLLDKWLFGRGGKATKEFTTKSFKQILASRGLDVLQEMGEEVLQEMSGVAVDNVFGLWASEYADLSELNMHDLINAAAISAIVSGGHAAITTSAGILSSKAQDIKMPDGTIKTLGKIASYTESVNMSEYLKYMGESLTQINDVIEKLSYSPSKERYQNLLYNKQSLLTERASLIRQLGEMTEIDNVVTKKGVKTIKKGTSERVQLLKSGTIDENKRQKLTEKLNDINSRLDSLEKTITDTQEELSSPEHDEAEANKRNNATDEIRKQLTDSVTQMYSSLRMLESITGRLGPDAITNAEKILTEVNNYAKSGEMDPAVISLYANMLIEQSELQGEVLTKSLKDKIKKKGIRGLLGIFKRKDKKSNDVEVSFEGDNLTKEQEKELNAKTREYFEKVMQTRSVIFAEKGESAVEDENGEVVVIPVDKVKHGVDDLFNSLAEQRLVETIASYEVNANILKRVTDTFRKISGKSNASTEEALMHLLFERSFFLAMLNGDNNYGVGMADADMYQFLSSLRTMEESIVPKDLRDETYKKKIKQAKSNWTTALITYLKLNPYADYQLDYFSADQIEQIKKVRENRDVANRMMEGKATATDIVLIDAKLNSTLFTAAQKIKLREKLFSNKPADIRKALIAIDNAYYTAFYSLYDGKHYMPTNSRKNQAFNKFLFDNGIDISTLTNVKDEVKKLIEETYGEFNTANLISFLSITLQEHTGKRYSLEILDGVDENSMAGSFKLGDLVVMIVDNNPATGYQHLGELGMKRIAKETDRTYITVSSRHTKLVNQILSPDAKEKGAGYYTINDVITDPTLLSKTLQKKVVDDFGELTPETAYAYLKHYFANTKWSLTLTVDQEGVVRFANVDNILSMFRDGDLVLNEKADTKVVTILNKNIDPYVNNTVIKVVKNSSECYFEARRGTSGYYGVIYIGDKVLADKNVAKIALAHEIQHAIQESNHINTGNDGEVLSSFSKEDADKIVASVKEKVPSLFENTNRKDVDIVNEFLYYGSGEIAAYGAEISDVIDFYPVLFKTQDDGKRILTLPWGDSYVSEKSFKSRFILLKPFVAKYIDFKHDGLDVLNELLTLRNEYVTKFSELRSKFNTEDLFSLEEDVDEDLEVYGTYVDLENEVRDFLNRHESLSWDSEMHNEIFEYITEAKSNIPEPDADPILETLTAERWAELDADYETALSNGDEKTARSLLEFAALICGFDVSNILYHSTYNRNFGFTSFNTPEAFLTTNLEVSQSYGGLSVKLRSLSDNTPYEILTEEELSTNLYRDANDVCLGIKESIRECLNIEDDVELYSTLTGEALNNFDLATLNPKELVDTAREVRRQLDNNLVQKSFKKRKTALGMSYEKSYDFSMSEGDLYNKYNEIMSSLCVGVRIKNGNTLYDVSSSMAYSLFEYYVMASNVRETSGFTLSFYGKTSGQFVADCEGCVWNNLTGNFPADLHHLNTRTLGDVIKASGYKSLVMKQIYDSARGDLGKADIYVFFNPNHDLKSADLVTYDDDGKVVPLSKRFKSEVPSGDFRKGLIVQEFFSKAQAPGVKSLIKEGSSDVATIKSVFYATVQDPGVRALADKVFEKFEERVKAIHGEMLPVNFVSDETIKKLYDDKHSLAGLYVPFGEGLGLNFNYEYLNECMEKEMFDEVSHTILHEMIHATLSLTIHEAEANVSESAWKLFERIGIPSPEILEQTPEIQAALSLMRIYKNVKTMWDPKVKTYGLESVDEFVAELSNPLFRQELKKISLWQSIVNFIKRIFGFTSENALSAASSAVEVILESDVTRYKNSDYQAFVKQEVKKLKKLGLEISDDGHYSGTIYHGSKRAFENVTYDPNKGTGLTNAGVGLYYTSDRNQAKRHGMHILTTDIDIDHVFTFAEGHVTNVDDLYKALGKKVPENVDWDTMKRDLKATMSEPGAAKRFTDAMLSMGYKGMYTKGYGYADPNIDQLVVYDSSYYNNLSTEIKKSAKTDTNPTANIASESAVTQTPKSTVKTADNVEYKVVDKDMERHAMRDKSDPSLPRQHKRKATVPGAKATKGTGTPHLRSKGEQHRGRVGKNAAKSHPNLAAYEGRQLADDMYNFIALAGTGEYANIDEHILRRVKNGTLTRNLILSYLYNVDSDSETETDVKTFELINRCFFNNKYFTSFKQLDEWITTKGPKYYALNALMRTAGMFDEIMALNSVEMLDNFEKVISNDPAYAKHFENISARFEERPGIDKRNLRRLWLEYFDGSIADGGYIGAIATMIAVTSKWNSMSINQTVGKSKDGKSTLTLESAISDKSDEGVPTYTRQDIDMVNEFLSKLGTDEELLAAVQQYYIDEITKAFKESSSDAEGRKRYTELKREWDMAVNEVEYAYGQDNPNRFNELYRKYIPETTSSQDVKISALEKIMSENPEYVKSEGDLEEIDLLRKLNERKSREVLKKVVRPQGNVANSIKSAANTIKNYIGPRQKKAFLELHGDIFDENLNVREELYKTKDDNGQVRYLDLDVLTELKRQVLVISRDTRAGFYNDRMTLKARENLKKRTQRLVNLITSAKVDKVKKDSKSGKTVKNVTVVTYTIGGTDIHFNTYSGNEMPQALREMVNTQLKDTAATKVKYLSNDNEEHFVKNLDTFIGANAEMLSNLNDQDVREIIDFLKTSTIVPGTDAIQWMVVSTIMKGYLLKMNEEGAGAFSLTRDDIEYLENSMKTVVSGAGTVLSLWGNMVKKYDAERAVHKALLKICDLELTEAQEKEMLDAVKSNDIKELERVRRKIYNELIPKYEGMKRTIWDRILRWERTCMLSGPGTWLRNKLSNWTMTGMNYISDLLMRPLKQTETQKRFKQYQLSGTKIESKYSEFIKTRIIDSGFLELIADGASRYDFRTDKKGNTKDPSVQLVNMIAQSISNMLYDEHSGAFKVTQNIQKAIAFVMSDQKSITKAFVRYLGKMMTEDKTDLSKGLGSKEILEQIVNAYTMAAFDYMHKPNFWTKLENAARDYLYKTRGRSFGDMAFFMYKQLIPFGAASWNWFVDKLQYNPITLFFGVKDLLRLENTVNKMENARQKGEQVVSERFAAYLAKRKISKGVIGSTLMILGVILWATGHAELDDEDNKYKLRIGEYYLDVSEFYGTSGMLAGVALSQTIAESEEDGITALIDGFGEALSSMFDDNTFSDLLSLLRRNNMNFVDAMADKLEDIPGMLIPNFIKQVSNFIPSPVAQYDDGIFGFAQRFAANSIKPTSYFMSHKVNPYTGDDEMNNNGLWWAPFIKLISIDVKPFALSDNERIALELGVHKGSLTGRYTIDDEDVKLTASEIEQLNVYYGKLNEKALTDFTHSKTKHTVTDSKDKNKKVELTYRQMDEKQKAAVIKDIMSDNSDLAKIYILTSTGKYKYYAGETEYKELRKLGLTKNVYLKNGKYKGFIKN